MSFTKIKLKTNLYPKQKFTTKIGKQEIKYPAFLCKYKSHHYCNLFYVPCCLAFTFPRSFFNDIQHSMQGRMQQRTLICKLLCLCMLVFLGLREVMCYIVFRYALFLALSSCLCIKYLCERTIQQLSRKTSFN